MAVMIAVSCRLIAVLLRALQVPAKRCDLDPRGAPSGGVNRKSSSGSFAWRFHLRMVTEYCGTSSSVL